MTALSPHKMAQVNAGLDDRDTRPLFATANAPQLSQVATLIDHWANANIRDSIGDLS
jgi:hypothetical protein